MKRLLRVLIFLLIAFTAVDAEENAEINLKTLFKLKYERPANPPQNELKIVNYILSNTHENNIHRMRGEDENKVYMNDDGREAVFDKNGELVTNSYNKGSYNYGTYEDPIRKFIVDIAPWLKWGNARDDPTSFDERLYYYTLDLNYGIQKYIFAGVNEKLETINFSQLSSNEKEVYYIFLNLIFSKDYKVKLSNETIERLKDDRAYYNEYFYQIQRKLGVKE